MCGICGKLTPGKPVDEALLRRMAGVVAYRGPDDEGFFLDGPGHGSIGIGLAHRRLSIIDLSDAGRQPMANEDGTIRIVFNGEIYNFKELRSELESRGHRFASRTDMEVVVHLYEEEGIKGFERLAGMFAFAVWDGRSRALLLCRDRIGIKPLVYGSFGGAFLFASEIKSILQDPAVPRQIDWNALNLYLTLNYIPAPYSIFKGIRKVLPGHVLIVKDGRAAEQPFWNIDTAGNCRYEGDFESAKKELFRTLESAVRSHMIADVPLGAFLSGGIDSSIITGLMARNSSKPVKTFTIGFADIPLFDETSYASEVARFHHTDHHEFKLNSRDMIETVPRLLDSFDEPFADSSAVPAFIVFRETASQVKAALSGDGGDELFAGYRMYSGESLFALYRKIPPFIRKDLIEPLFERLPESRDRRSLEYLRRIKKFLRGAGDGFEERFFAWNEIFSTPLRREIFSRTQDMDLDLGSTVFARRLNEIDSDPINRMLYCDLKESLPGDMLRKVDSMSMLNSLEVRVPLLDHRVCELAFSMPGEWKLRRGRGKHILIETFREMLPPSLHNRPKWGFEVPISRLLKTDLTFLVDVHLDRSLIEKQGIFNYECIRKLIDEHRSGRSDRGWHLWNLIVFQVWHANYIK